MSQTVLKLEEAGPLHQLTEVRIEKGHRVVTVRCRAKMRPEKADERQQDWTAWECYVTCPACLDGSRN